MRRKQAISHEWPAQADRMGLGFAQQPGRAERLASQEGGDPDAGGDAPKIIEPKQNLLP